MQHEPTQTNSREANELKEVTPPGLSPAAMCRRWLFIACALAILGTCVAYSLEKWAQVRLNPVVFFVGFWTVTFACEAILQFDRWPRRLLWIVAGMITGVCFGSSFRHGETPGKIFLFYLLAAALQSLAAIGVRRLPWIWIIANLVLFGAFPQWANAVSNAIRQAVGAIRNIVYIPFADYAPVAQFVTVFAIILITRAVVGSFVASRKTS